MASMLERVSRAARLDPSLYEEVEADPSSMGQATAVVVLASIAGGIGTAGIEGQPGFVLGLIVNLVGWYIWAFLTYIIGTRLLPQPATEADMGQLLRTLGFAAAPGLLRGLGFLPGIGAPIMIAAAAWGLAAMIVAVRQALDYDSTWRAVLVCLIGWFVQILIIMIPFFVIGSFSASAGQAPAA
ncbi:YIP1 family protein [bacterium]|nr:YIP1 family protein [bacterium]